MDLPNPERESVNDRISVAASSLSYMSTDDVAKVVAKLGVGSLLGKMDVQSAYRIIPVHPEYHGSWAFSGRVEFMWTLASHLACGQLPLSSQL